jgi:TPR repeat protein
MLIGAGQALADFRQADQALARKDYATVLSTCAEDARRGEKHCQSHLGNLYRYGLGVSRDYSQAVHWLQASAAQQQPYAQEALAQLKEYCLKAWAA